MLKTTREQLEKLKALEAQATPEPWACGDSTGKTHWAGKESIVGVIGAATDRQVAILCSANYNFRECIENMPVIAESRNALDALLHDAAVAHRILKGMDEILIRLRDLSICDQAMETEMAYQHAAEMLEALLSAAKGAE